MKPVLVDASSAILLHKADLLLTMQAAFRFYVTSSVYSELTDYQRPGAQAIAQGRQARRITIVTPNRDNGPRDLPGHLHQGERDTLLCFLDGGFDFIVIDDGRGAGVCRQASIPYLNALLCPRVLALSGHLSPGQARDAMARLMTLGRYSGVVETYAKTCSASDLMAFLPEQLHPPSCPGA